MVIQPHINKWSFAGHSLNLHKWSFAFQKPLSQTRLQIFFATNIRTARYLADYSFFLGNHSYGWHDSVTYVTWLIHMCDMTHSHIGQDSFMWVIWLTHVWVIWLTHVHDLTWRIRWSFICVTWLTHICDMTHPYVWHDSLTYATWLIHMCDMTHSHMWHDSFICVTWITHSHIWHESLSDIWGNFGQL